MKDEMKAWVWRASGEGSGGEAVDMVLGILVRGGGRPFIITIMCGGYSGLERGSSSVLIFVIAVLYMYLPT